MQNSTALNTMSIQSFCVTKGFTSFVPAIRANAKGYPYITFIDKDNKAENIYFSRKGAEKVGAGQPVTKELISQFQIADNCKNEAGELRTKFISNSERTDVNNLW